MTPCPLIFPLESFCLEDVTVHETSLGMSQYIFLHNWGMLVKKASQSIKVLMAEKTGHFVRASDEVGFHSKNLKYLSCGLKSACEKEWRFLSML